MKSLVRLYTKELRNNLAEALFTNSCMYVFYLRWQLMWKPISYMLPSLTVCRSENVFHFPFFLISFPSFFFGPQNYEGGVVVWYKSALHLARKLVNRFSQTSVTFFSEYLRGSLWVQFSFGLSQFVLNPTRIILWELVGGIGKLPKLDKWMQNITPDQLSARWRILTPTKTTEGQYSPRTARASIRTKVVY